MIRNGWPRQLRLLINKECNYQCSFPGTCHEWCHKDGIHLKSEKGREGARVDDFLFLAEALKQPFELEKLKIGAMEPTLYPGVEELVVGAKDLGFAKVSLTSNGYFLGDKLVGLKKAGLDILTVSMHAFNKEGYRLITRVDGFEKVKSTVEKAVEMGFGTVKINRVLLNFPNSWDDLMKFFDWAVRIGVRIKLYKLIWSPTMEAREYYENYVPWESLMIYFKDRARLLERVNYSVAGRERLVWRLDNGLELETDIFSHKLSDGVAKVCRECRFASFCLEGMMSYGIEVNSELLVSACLLREDLVVDVWNEVRARDSRAVVEKVEEFIGKII